MSLEGTLSTIALPDVLALLSVTSKTGELRVESDGGVGRVWLDAGRIAGFDVGNQRSAVDALFALLRLPEGNFKFHTGTDPLNAIEPEEVNPLLEQADERLQEWPSIAAIVPSLSAELSLEPSATDDVLLTPDEWRMVSSVPGRTVEEVLTLMSLSEFDGCKAIKGLVDRHLMKVDAFGVAPQLPVLSPLTVVEQSTDERLWASGVTSKLRRMTTSWSSGEGPMAPTSLGSASCPRSGTTSPVRSRAPSWRTSRQNLASRSTVACCSSSSAPPAVSSW